VRLSAWLRDKRSLGREPLAEGAEDYLVVLPAPHIAHRYVLLHPLAARVLDTVAFVAAGGASCSRAALDAALAVDGGPAPSTADVATWLAWLVQQGALDVAAG
jgi:hypothetical protein